jgi:Mor family transcriptional regulator
MNERTVKQAALRYQDCILQPYDAMMDMDGFDAICTFSKTFGGTSVYVPSVRTIFGQCLEKDMLNAWNGANVRELVQKYGFSERHIRDLIKREK